MSEGEAPLRHAIVTGGSLGIGLEIARRLHAAGFALTLVARRPAPLEAARAALAEGGGAPVSARVADVADAEALAAAIAAAEAEHGPCHTLVAAAGQVVSGRFEDVAAADLAQQMAVNYLGAVAAVRAVYPGMVARGEGRVVLIASAAALIGIYGYSAYAASKFALRGFAEALRAEAKPAGVRVSIAYPGDTDTAQHAEELATRPAETSAIAGQAALMTPQRVADIIVRGVDRGTFAIYPNLKTAALGRTASLIAPALAVWFDGIVARMRRR